MTVTHVAFLRAINTGSRRITNDGLVAAAAAAGFPGSVAYQASGNLFLSDRAEPIDELAATLAKGLERELDYPVPAYVRSAARVGEIALHRPFGDDDPAPGQIPQVLFLAGPPDDATADDILAHASPADRLAIDGAELFWWPTQGVSTSDLALAAIERLAGGGTLRTHGTVQRIATRIGSG